MFTSKEKYMNCSDFQHDQFFLAQEWRRLDIIDKLGYVEYLDLSSEILEYEDIKYICKKLKSNKKITDLYLSNCNIYCKHSFLIAEMIKFNKVLNDLDLSNNFIRDEGAKVIIEALKINNTLDTIWLNDNYISDEYMDFFNNYNKGK